MGEGKLTPLTTPHTVTKYCTHTKYYAIQIHKGVFSIELYSASSRSASNALLPTRSVRHTAYRQYSES